MTTEQIQRAKELRNQGVSLRKIAGELGVSHETVRQYLKVHEGVPEAGVVRETTTVKKVSEFVHLLDTGQIMGKQTPKVGEAQPAEEKKPYLLGERGVAGALAISHETVPRSRCRKRNDNCKIIIQNG
jgi:transcriptional regulator with XRE-family HTH domain